MAWIIATDEAMRAWGEALGRRLLGGALLYLSGDLGAGKTTLAGGILRGYGHVGRTKSPTYNLVETYDTPHGPAYHFDLYRLNSPEELGSLGFRDYLSEGVLCLVEWPERGGLYMPQPDIHLDLHVSAEAHRIHLRMVSPRLRGVLE